MTTSGEPGSGRTGFNATDEEDRKKTNRGGSWRGQRRD